MQHTADLEVDKEFYGHGHRISPVPVMQVFDFAFTLSPVPHLPRDLGVPVKSLNWVRLHPGRNAKGEPILLASMGQDNGGLFVCDIDLDTGHCTQYPCGLEISRFPTSPCMNPRTGVLYIGAAYSGHLHRFDPNAPPAERKLEDLGAIDPELCVFPCRVDETPDGSIYIGGYGGASLTRFHPATGQFTRFGSMDPTDKYLYPLCGKDGTIAAVVRVCMVHVILFDPKTGEHKTVGPTIDVNAAGGGALGAAAFDLIRGTNGLLYIQSSQGNFRLSGMEATPVDAIPAAEPKPTLPDGSRVEFLDAAAQIYRKLRITSPAGATRDLTVDWEGQGTAIFLLHAGFDGKLYGSSILPEHFFRCNADGSEMTDLGQCSVSTGEAYSMASFEKKIYIASYPEARLSIYDPAKPYKFGEEEGANPRDIGRLDKVSYRPRAMLAGPAGKVWIGSAPDYGLWGGTLVNYDPATAKIVSHRHLVQDASVSALAWLPKPGQLLVGLSIHGGSGTTPRIDAVPFVWWDPTADQAVATDAMGIPNIEGVMALAAADDGSVYAMVGLRGVDAATGKPKVTADLLHLDPAVRRVLGRNPFTDADGWPAEISLVRGPDGAIYGATTLQVFRITPGSTRREILWSITADNEREYIHAAGAVIGKRFYFNAQHRLRCIELP
jgi:hypothetical protein